jgi:hypothetical protein
MLIAGVLFAQSASQRAGAHMQVARNISRVNIVQVCVQEQAQDTSFQWGSLPGHGQSFALSQAPGHSIALY